LYLSDNDLTLIPMKIKNFENLEILSLRDNEIVSVPQELEFLHKIHELHLQVLPLNYFDPRDRQYF